jgi:hypothetical protein
MASTCSALPAPQRLNHLDHLVIEAKGPNLIWGILALGKGKMAMEGGYP